MVNLEFCDTHNMVSYLQKPEGSEGFHQIVDFLNTSHIRYALTKNPTIYASLIQQFWKTTTASTLNNGEIEITATTDGKVKVKLEDSDGISILPTTKIFEQLALMGQGGAATTITSLDVGQGSGNINKNPSMLHDLPLLRVHTLRSDEDRMQHNELMDLVKKLEKTMKTSQAIRKANIVVSDDEEDLEDPSKQGRKIHEIDQDPNILLIQHDAEIQGRYDQDMKFNLEFDVAKEVSTAEKEVSIVEPVSTAGAAVTITGVDVSPARRISTADENTMAETLVFIRRSAAKDKAMRLQKELDEEERQRMARVHEAAQSFSMEEWENIRARVKADEELTQKLQSEEMNKYSEVDQAKMLVDLINQRKRYFTLFETTMRRVNTFVPMESEVDRAVLEFTTGSSKGGVEKELDQRNSKRLKTNEVFGLEQPDEEENELSQEDLQKMMMVVPVEEVYVEALQFKYPTIDWEVYTEESRKY
nr:hypothetical protein [Tanacetum cinerariifolium]